MLDPDCAICCALADTITSLSKIANHIDWSCSGSKKKEDFGLTKSFLMEQIGTIKKMEKYHQYYHSTGESLIETNRQVNSDMPKPKRFRRP